MTLQTNTAQYPTAAVPQNENITVIQGEIAISSNPHTTLTTILGSCISVCMWDEKVGIGGMNHFLLSESTDNASIKHGAYAMEMLINKLLRAGAQRNNLQSKVFGGASVSNLKNEIGQNNAIFARTFLQNEGISCLAESVGGDKARRVRFDPTTGNAKLMFVQPTDVAPLRPQPIKAPVEITLF